MKWKKIGRTLVCLLLVCCLLINISPIRAKATGAEIAIASAAVAALVIPAIFIACGVSPGESPTDFDYAVDSCKQFLADAGEFLMDGLTAPVVWMAGNAYVAGQFVDAVRGWLVDSGTVTTSDWDFYDCISFGSCDLATARSLASRCSVAYVGTLWGETGVICASSASIVSVSGEYVVFDYSAGNFAFWYADNAAFRRATGNMSMSDWSVLAYSPEMVTAQDLVLNSFMAPSVSIATGYADWAAGAISVPGSMVGIDEEEEVLAYPLGFGQTYEETRDMTQADVQSGTGTYVDTKTEVLTGTFADTAIGTFINSLIDALWTPIEWIGAQIAAVPAAITDFFTFDTDISTYVVEISSFFPFCIPWDIYHFFELFQAEPEAPHFVFDVPFPYMEDDWHIEIDLSIWDKQAALTRTLELIGFIVGLALFTREKFLRG